MTGLSSQALSLLKLAPRFNVRCADGCDCGRGGCGCAAAKSLRGRCPAPPVGFSDMRSHVPAAAAPEQDIALAVPTSPSRVPLDCVASVPELWAIRHRCASACMPDAAGTLCCDAPASGGAAAGVAPCSPELPSFRGGSTFASWLLVVERAPGIQGRTRMGTCIGMPRGPRTSWKV